MVQIYIDDLFSMLLIRIYAKKLLKRFDIDGLKWQPHVGAHRQWLQEMRLKFLSVRKTTEI